MPITVLKNNVPWGPFTRAQIGDGLARGDFTLSYLAHAPGLREWLPLGEVLDYFDRGSALPPLPVPEQKPPVPVWADPPGRPAVPAPFPKDIALPPVPVPLAKTPAPPVPVQSPLPVSTPPSPPVSPAAIKIPPPAPEAPWPELKAAPFIPRFCAFAIDCGVLFLPVVFLFGIGALTIQIEGWAEHNAPETMHQEWIRLHEDFQDLLGMMALGGAWLYAALLECSNWQATVGKKWMGLKVTDRRGEPLTLLRATGRHAAKFLSALPCFLGFTAALFSSRGLALHDRIAGTRVLRR